MAEDNKLQAIYRCRPGKIIGDSHSLAKKESGYTYLGCGYRRGQPNG